MNNNKKQSEREILEEILLTLNEQKTTLEMIIPNPLRTYNNKEIMGLLGVKDKYLKKLRDNGYLGFSREGDKYWYTQKDVDCFLHSFHYEPFKSDKNRLWTL